MTTERTIEVERAGPVTTVWMSRPEVHNALNEAMIGELSEAFRAAASDATARVVVLAGRGKSFSAGADAEWMRRQGAAGPIENLEDARKLAEMFRVIASLPLPTVARVNGAAIGGGLGLVAACDIAVAASGAVFATSEVRLGLIPATIGPYVLRAIGARQARRYFLTGERMDAQQALRIGLVHDVAEPAELDARVRAVVEALLAGAPGAQSAAKELIDATEGRAPTAELIEDTALRIARVRSGEEAREGLSAFLEKRAARWVQRG